MAKPTKEEVEYAVDMLAYALNNWDDPSAYGSVEEAYHVFFVHANEGKSPDGGSEGAITCPKHNYYACTRIWNTEGTHVVGHYCPICTGLISQSNVKVGDGNV